jgi:hypothetical protein
VLLRTCCGHISLDVLVFLKDNSSYILMYKLSVRSKASYEEEIHLQYYIVLLCHSASCGSS